MRSISKKFILLFLVNLIVFSVGCSTDGTSQKHDAFDSIYAKDEYIDSNFDLQNDTEIKQDAGILDPGVHQDLIDSNDSYIDSKDSTVDTNKDLVIDQNNHDISQDIIQDKYEDVGPQDMIQDVGQDTVQDVTPDQGSDTGGQQHGFCYSFDDCGVDEVCNFALGRCEKRSTWTDKTPAVYSFHPLSASKGDILILDGNGFYHSMLGFFLVAVSIGGQPVSLGIGKMKTGSLCS